MKLEILDAFGTLPEHLKGKFDVVHIRAFTIVVKGGHPGSLLDNLIAMLSNYIISYFDNMRISEANPWMKLQSQEDIFNGMRWTLHLSMPILQMNSHQR